METVEQISSKLGKIKYVSMVWKIVKEYYDRNKYYVSENCLAKPQHKFDTYLDSSTKYYYVVYDFVEVISIDSQFIIDLLYETSSVISVLDFPIKLEKI